MFEQFRWDFRSPEERGDAGENIIYNALNKVHGRKALLLNDYLGKHPELHKVDEYVDDGYSGRVLLFS